MDLKRVYLICGQPGYIKDPVTRMHTELKTHTQLGIHRVINNKCRCEKKV